MAAKIVSEIDSFNTYTHFKIGLISIVVIFLTYYVSNKFAHQHKFIFTSFFNYSEGLEIGSDVVLAGIVVGDVTNLELKDNGVLVYGAINSRYPIPSDSILIIRSNGIFGEKSLLIEPGFGDKISDNYFEFIATKDSYSVDMFLRYMAKINE